MAVIAAAGEEGISLLERNFLLGALTERQRLDGRRDTDFRQVDMSFTRYPNKATADVSFGQDTRVYAVVTCEVVPPFPDRPMEGFLRFNVELSPMASPGALSGKASSDTTEISSVVERVIKDSRAVDTEALCIVSGEKVWSLRCDIHILDHGGNLIDASCLSAMAALMHFRRPDISVQGDKIKIHTYEERAPVPLSIHHIPVCVSYGIFPIGSIQEAVSKGANPTSEDTMRTLETGEDVLVLDPTHKEEHAMEGKITFALNAHGELCGIHKLGGAALAKDVTMRAAKHASVVAANIVSTLKSTLVKADELEKERDRVRHSLAAGYRTDSNKLIPLFNEFMDLHDDEKESASKTNTTVHLDGSDFLKDSYVRLPSAEQKKKHKSFPMRGDEESQETHQETKAVSGSTNEMSKSHSDNSSQDDDMLDDEFDT